MQREPNLFDVDAFYITLDGKRRGERKHWRDVCREAGISASTISRMSLDGKLPDVPNLTRLLLWLGDTDIKSFVREAGEQT